MEVDSHFPPLTLKKEGFSEWTHIYNAKTNNFFRYDHLHPNIPVK